jgi:hypothetical protein
MKRKRYAEDGLSDSSTVRSQLSFMSARYSRGGILPSLVVPGSTGDFCTSQSERESLTRGRQVMSIKRYKPE